MTATCTACHNTRNVVLSPIEYGLIETHPMARRASFQEQSLCQVRAKGTNRRYKSIRSPRSRRQRPYRCRLWWRRDQAENRAAKRRQIRRIPFHRSFSDVGNAQFSSIGFTKSQRPNIDDDDVRQFKQLAAILLPAREDDLDRLIERGDFTEAKPHENP